MPDAERLEAREVGRNVLAHRRHQQRIGAEQLEVVADVACGAAELTLTDTQDNPIARRVFQPGEYLAPQNPPEQAFPANTDIPVRLWIEAKEITAAGYRLYVFYP